MAYIGTPPQSGFITTAKQRVTGSTNNYVDLDNSISSLADVIVWVNSVKQDSTNLTLTTSTRITLGGTLTASDVVEIAYLGKAVATQTPDNGTITLDMLSASGTKSSSTFLRGDNTFSTVTSTTINNNADNRVITGSGTANTLEGESSLTWNGSSLGVGLASPETTAHIQSASGECELRLTAASTSDARLRFGDTTTTAGAYIGANRSTEDMYFRSKNSGAANMQLNTNGYLKCLGVYNQSAGDSANVVVDGSGNIYRSTSALKYKQDIRDLESIDISSFRPVRYKSKSPKDDPEKDFIGFIADEFHDAGLTELVSYGQPDEEGNPVVEGFNYDRLTAVLTKALQEAITKIETLEARVQTLEDA